MKRLLALLFCTAFAQELCAQNSIQSHVAEDGTTQYYSETRFTGRIVDSLTREPLPGAVLSVVSASPQHSRTVRNYVTDKQGNFSFICMLDRQNRLEVSYLGYKILQVPLHTNEPEYRLGDLRLSQDVHAIDNVVVKARLQMYKSRGDTLIYLPKAINTMEGDKALEILRHMPGVEVDGKGRVSVMGEPIVRTYVNQKLLFGEDPTIALKQLDASEIASIEAYDEVDEESKVQQGKNAKKKKVINVVTFKEFSRSLSARALVEAGADFNRDAQGERLGRYRAEGEAGYYSERLQIEAGGKTDNRPQPQARVPYTAQRESAAHASLSGRQGKHATMDVRYNYNSTLRTNDIFTRRDYFQTPDITSQRLSDTTRTNYRESVHDLAAKYAYQSDVWTVSFNANGSFRNLSGESYLHQQTEYNGALLSPTKRDEVQRGEVSNFNGNLDVRRKWQKNSLSMSFNINRSNSTAHILREEWHEDRLMLESNSRRPGTSVRGSLGYAYATDRVGSFSVGMNAEVRPENNYTLAVDPVTKILNVALSEDNRGSAVTISPNVGYQFNKGRHFVMANAAYTMQSIHFENRMLGGGAQTRVYQAPQLMLNYNYRPSAKRSLAVVFFNMLYPLNSAAFSTVIDNRNPMLLSAGNPSIRPTIQYQLGLTANLLGKKSSSVVLGLDLRLSHHEQIYRHLYFTQSTVLDEYGGYVAPAGSTLMIPDNGSYSVSISPSVSFKTRLAPLRCFLELATRYRYKNPQQWNADRLTRAQRHFGEFSIGVTTNFSPKVKLSLKSRSQYEWFRNSSGYRDNSFSEQLNAGLRWDFLGNMFLTTNFMLEVLRNSTNSAIRADNYILNASLGCRVLKRRGSVSFNAYDLLDRNSGFSMDQNDNFVSYQWQRMGGSYFSFVFEYKFNGRS